MFHGFESVLQHTKHTVWDAQNEGTAHLLGPRLRCWTAMRCAPRPLSCPLEELEPLDGILDGPCFRQHTSSRPQMIIIFSSGRWWSVVGGSIHLKLVEFGPFHRAAQSELVAPAQRVAEFHDLDGQLLGRPRWCTWKNNLFQSAIGKAPRVGKARIDA